MVYATANGVKNSMTRRIIVALADTHAGHKLGLCNPQVMLPEEDEQGVVHWVTPPITFVQKWLWECYEEDRAAVKELAQGDPITILHNGDLTWGKRYPDGLMTTRIVDQYIIAESNLLPWFLLPNVTTVRLMHGTQSHESGEGSAPIMVAKGLHDMGRDIKTAQHGLYDVDGVLFDVAHHGPSLGIRHWLRGRTLRYMTQSLMQDCIARGKKPPDVILRAHRHELVWITERYMNYTCEAIALPAYCGMTHYAQQATQSAFLLTCGLVALVLEDGQVTGVHPFAREVDLRTAEKL